MTASRTIPARVDTRFRGGMAAADDVDVRGLRRRLEQELEGEVHFDAGYKAMYATDASNYRQVPLGVVIPKTLEDVVATHRVCHQFGAPVLARGGGTSLSGETVNFAVVIDVSKYLTEIDDSDRDTETVICQPGVINEKLNQKTGEQIGMIFGPDPSTRGLGIVSGPILAGVLIWVTRSGPFGSSHGFQAMWIVCAAGALSSLWFLRAMRGAADDRAELRRQ